MDSWASIQRGRSNHNDEVAATADRAPLRQTLGHHSRSSSMKFSQVRSLELVLDLTVNEFNSSTIACTENNGNHPRQANRHGVGGEQSVIKNASQDGPRSNGLAHTPYRILTSADIRLGYFESSVVPSSNQAKENIGGTQSGSLA